MSKSLERRLAIQKQNNEATNETFNNLAESSKKYNNLSTPELLEIDRAVVTILEELEITDNLVNATIDVSNSNTQILMEKIKKQEKIIEKYKLEESKYIIFLKKHFETLEEIRVRSEENLKKQVKQEEIILALQTQILKNTSSKMIELSTENEKLKQELKINDLALRIAVNTCGKVTAVQAYQLAKKAIEDVNNGN